MADAGISAAFTFGGTTYNADDCIQNTQLQRSINPITYQCNGNQRTLVGAKIYLFSYQLAIAKDDTAKVTNLDEGSTGAFEYHPGGDTSGNIEITSTKGTAVRCDISAAANGFITIDGQIALDDITNAVAT